MMPTLPPPPPNIVYVFPDQLRNSALGFWSASDYRELINFKSDPVYTPNIDQFARESVVLSNAQSGCPLCSPHRGMLLTGMYPNNSGVTLNCNASRPISSLKLDAICLSDVYRSAGYDCGYIGKLHLDHPTPNDPDHPGKYVEARVPAWDAYTPPSRRHGFNYWYSYGTYDVHKHPHYWDTNGKKHEINEWSAEHEATMAIDYITNKNKVRDVKKPFFLVVSMNPPHHPYYSLKDCMKQDYDLYKDKSLSELLVRPNADTSMEKAHDAAFYFAAISGVDREFGRILAALKEQGLEENTIVVFSSDHGETMCSHSLKDAKNSPYREAMNVPFILRYPLRVAARVDPLLLATPDIMPTLLGLSGLGKKIPKSVQGHDYSQLFTDVHATEERPKGVLYIRNVDGKKDAQGQVRSYIPIARGVKTQRFTLSITLNPQTMDIDNILFFDDLADPYQLHNLDVKKHAKEFKALCDQLAGLLKEANDPWYTNKTLATLIKYQ